MPSLKDTVRDVLKYHVLASKVLKADVPPGRAIDPVLPGNAIFKIDATGGKCRSQMARNRTAEITATDILASNGVVHLINKVILPANQNIIESAIASTGFSIWWKPSSRWHGGTLSGSGPFTVFAPTDPGFAHRCELGVTKGALLADFDLTRVLLFTTWSATGC
ncbi:MAG: fasciclin domain-containing protein [Uliginosibacterium sp.]|nr:fasciclin domain-containing protein [Uliginosibacterium sp.]